MKLFISILLFFVTTLSYGDCSSEEEKKIFDAFSSVNTWVEFESAYCAMNDYDDGYISEMISTKTVELIVTDFERLQAYDSNNLDFLDFVFKHLDETMTYDEFANIEGIYKEHCSNDSSYACRKLNDSIMSLKENQ